ncbi:MAG: DNA primase, partial [Chloroflexi bacterium]|nr:DNA primase [Chloroflexota bacterium]
MSVSEEIKDRLDIVDIISGRVTLRKTGRNFVGFCPFHSNTKTPAFTVFPATQSYYCFGCGQSGDAFTFLMKLDNLEFKDVLSQLAEKVGVTLTSRPESKVAEESRQTRLREINQAAAQFFHNLLLKSDEARATREYMVQRGVSDSSVTVFQLGFAPDRWDDLFRYLLAKEVSPEEIEAAGLVVERDDGRIHDRFRHRLMFPIRDKRGQVIGFGGRALDERPPKYLNSPQTELFDKSAVLYAIDLAFREIESGGEAVIVEGYMDAIIAHQYGLSNVVASMGTA